MASVPRASARVFSTFDWDAPPPLEILAVRRAVLARSGKERLVSGHDIMREFGIRPGPIVGRLLKAVEEGQALGKIGNKAAALRAAKAELDRARDR